jgi:hypothetical protein
MQVIIRMAVDPGAIDFSVAQNGTRFRRAERGRQATRLHPYDAHLRTRTDTMMDEWNSDRSLQADGGDVERDDKDQAAKRRKREEKRKAELDDTLERGLEDTFPGSDPVAITQPPHSARDKGKP